MSFFKPRALEAAPTRRSAALIFVAITVCLDVLSQSITFPILPRLAQQFLGGDAAAAARWVGYLEVAWVIPQFFAAPVLGMLSDRFGRRPVIVLSVLGVGLEFIICALAPTIVWLLVGRVLCGLCCGTQAAAMAYVADITAPEERAGRYGTLNAAAWTGVIAGPALGGLFGAIDLRAPFWLAAIVAIAGGIYGYFVLPESLAIEARAPIRWSRAHPWGALGLILRAPELSRLGLVFFLMWFVGYAVNAVFVLYTAYRYGWTPLALGAVLSVMAGANIVVQGGLAGRIARWLGERSVVMVGLLLSAAGCALMGLAPTGLLFCAAYVPMIVGNIVGPSLQSLMTAMVPLDEQGRLQGALGSVGGLTGFIAPVAFTQLFAWSVEPTRGGVWSGATYFAGAGISLAAWVVVAGFMRGGRSTAPRPA